MRKYIITAGGTSEKIDKVRKITNSSTGRLGLEIANEVLKEDKTGEIYYICSKGNLRPIDERLKVIEIDGVNDLKNKVEILLSNEHINFFIHSMAVSDYTLNYVTTLENIRSSLEQNEDFYDAMSNVKVMTGSKLSSYEDNLVIVLKPTPKIISIIKNISPETFLVGFKLLDGVSFQELIDVAKRLRDSNSCDLVVANDLENIRKGVHKAYIIDRDDSMELARGKEDIAKKLVRRFNYEK